MSSNKRYRDKHNNIEVELCPDYCILKVGDVGMNIGFSQCENLTEFLTESLKSYKNEVLAPLIMVKLAREMEKEKQLDISAKKKILMDERNILTDEIDFIANNIGSFASMKEQQVFANNRIDEINKELDLITESV